MESKCTAQKDKLKPHPLERSNFLGKLFFCWTIPTFKRGLRRELSEEDLYQTPKEHDSHILVKKFEKAWKNQWKKNSKPSLWDAIWKVFKWDILLNAAVYLLSQFILKIARPLALGKLMGYYSPNRTDTSNSDAVIYASIIVVASFVDAVISNFFIIHYQQTALKVQIACSSLIYRKALRLSKGALSKTTVGHIINLLSNDMEKVYVFWCSVHDLWAAPIQAVIILSLLYSILGPTALVGISFLAVLIPLQLFMSHKSSIYRLRIALKTDERIRHMNEIISGIQVIKVYTWEIPFVKLIDAIRRQEIRLVRIANYLEVMSDSFAFFIDRTAIFLCILTYVLTGNRNNAEYVFVVSSFYDILMNSVSLYFPDAVADLLQARVSVKRFEDFLNLEEIHSSIKESPQIGVKVLNATAKWSEDSMQNTLNDIDFDANSGELIAIIGPIGGGKSSLLQLFLNEIPKIKGSVEIGGTISYANQEPWLFDGSIKQNILFGQQMDLNKYKEVVRVCALERDFSLFPYGDNTIVGERGILLSGGQKARINLARAVYKEADIYLLDDPLSAVDASVGKQIFTNCINGYLKNKCIVLVTHHIQYLSYVDKIYLVVNGMITASGTYKNLQDSGEDFTRLLNNSETHDQLEESSTIEATTEVEDYKEKEEEKEIRSSGQVSSKVYIKYLQAAGTCLSCFVILIMFIATEGIATGSDYYVTFWINLEQKRMAQNQTASDEYRFFTTENCIYLYSAIIISLMTLSTVRSISFVKNCMRASVDLHNKMFSSIVNATMTFFHSNSSGRILNRFAKDIGNVDETLPKILLDALQCSLGVIGTTLAICLVSPWSTIPTIIIFLIMYLIRRIFMASSTTLKRIEGITRSPIFAHLTESMKGLTTIRAFKATPLLQREFDNFQNKHSSVFYLYAGCKRAFASWLDCVCVLYVLAVTIIALINEKYGGNVGFTITQAMSLTGMFEWAVRQLSELDNQMTSVERICEYAEVERESNNDNKGPLKIWPEEGKIEFNSVFMQYSPNDPYVLKNLTLVIKPREKIGIVGRTGAGKSSLISVLFRLVNFEGELLIDDVNTKKISLSSLRSNISIIPQDPVLFSGSVRKNLDPFDQYQDSEIWNVLEEVKLKEFVTQLPLGLHSNLSEGGSNFSVGQKQLICLARALLRNNKILVLDEATANVDPYTDELLQQTIRKSFSSCTVLTVAHRLHTIMDSDKVLVMDDGDAVEFDHPYNLIEKKGVFYSLVMETGNKMGEFLVEIAQKNYSANLDFRKI